MKTYKHYCNDSNTSCKLISGLRGATPDQIEELSNWQEKQTKDMFRKMQLTIENFDDSSGEIEQFLETDPTFLEEHGDLNFTDVLYGELPEWELVKTEVYTTGILFYYYRFGENGKVEDWFIIDLSVPYSISLKINIESDNRHSEVAYKITMALKTDGDDDACIAIEYFSNGEKKYTSTLEEDDRGVYELITTA